MKELKTKTEMLSHKVHVVSPQAGTEFMVGKICELKGFEPAVKERELQMVRVVS